MVLRTGIKDPMDKKPIRTWLKHQMRLLGCQTIVAESQQRGKRQRQSGQCPKPQASNHSHGINAKQQMQQSCGLRHALSHGAKPLASVPLALPREPTKGAGTSSSM